MLWTGEGLSNLLPWLPAGARAALAVWLPVAFKVAIGLIVVGLAYRLFFSQPRNRGPTHARQPPGHPSLGGFTEALGARSAPAADRRGGLPAQARILAPA